MVGWVKTALAGQLSTQLVGIVRNREEVLIFVFAWEELVSSRAASRFTCLDMRLIAREARCRYAEVCWRHHVLRVPVLCLFEEEVTLRPDQFNVFLLFVNRQGEESLVSA